MKNAFKLSIHMPDIGIVVHVIPYEICRKPEIMILRDNINGSVLSVKTCLPPINCRGISCLC